MSVILLINEDALQGWWQQEELELRGFTVHLARTHELALGLMNVMTPDVVVLDSGPPGSTACHRLASDLAVRSAVPVILNASSLWIEERLFGVYCWQPAAVVLKSSDLGPLLRAIDRILSGSLEPAEQEGAGDPQEGLAEELVLR